MVRSLRRILLSSLIIFTLITIISSSVYSFLSDIEKTEGVVLSAGTTNLQVELLDELDLESMGLGETREAEFKLTNLSSENINLNVSAQIVNYKNDWDLLKDKIQISITELGEPDNFQDLEFYRLDSREITNTALDPNNPRNFNLKIKIKQNLDLEQVSAKNINFELEFLGIQAI